MPLSLFSGVMLRMDARLRVVDVAGLLTWML